MGFKVWSLGFGFRVWSLGFRVLRFGVWGLEFAAYKVEGLGFIGLGFRVREAISYRIMGIRVSKIDR